MTTVATMTRVETRFGVFETADRDVIHMPAGLPAFEQCHEFVLASGPAIHPFNCLHGLDDPKPSFLVIDPRLVISGYRQRLSPMDLRRLDARDGEPLLWLAIVHLGVGDRATVNLRAPIVVNPRRMTAIQVLPHESPYRHNHPMGLEAADAGLHP
jgi:flagellar assembly factor FliW